MVSEAGSDVPSEVMSDVPRPSTPATASDLEVERSAESPVRDETAAEEARNASPDEQMEEGGEPSFEDGYQLAAMDWLRRSKVLLGGIAAACVAGFVAVVALVLGRPGQGLDGAFYDISPGFDIWELARVLMAVRSFGNEFIAGPIALMVFLWAFLNPRLKPHAVYGAAVFILGVAVATALKVALGQPGPPEWGTNAPAEPYMALPSGHTVIGSLLFGVLALHSWLLYPRMRLGMTILFAEMALGIGLAQSLLRIHWLSDAVTAWLFAGAWLAGAALLLPRFLGVRGPAAAEEQARTEWAQASWEDTEDYDDYGDEDYPAESGEPDYEGSDGSPEASYRGRHRTAD